MTESERFWCKVDKKGPNECWNWIAGLTSTGYGQFNINRNGKRKSTKAHRWIFNYPVLCVLHTCDNRKCVNPNHLFLGTNKDNINDMLDKGRGNRGEKNGGAKLTEEDVIYIRKLQKYINQNELAKYYNVSRVTISNIINYKKWKHI